MVDYGYLRDKRRGFIGGEVEDDETIDEALDREMVEELAEALHLPQLAIQSQILLQFLEPVQREFIILLFYKHSRKNLETKILSGTCMK